MIDALQITAKKPFDLRKSPLNRIPKRKRIILVTAHRRENFGKPLDDICNALRQIADRYSDVQIVYPVHLNPSVQKPVNHLLSNVPNITLLPPLDYSPFVQLMKLACIVLTDSGGIQEEAPSLGKPVLVLRDVTELSVKLRVCWRTTRHIAKWRMRSILMEMGLLLNELLVHYAGKKSMNTK